MAKFYVIFSGAMKNQTEKEKPVLLPRQSFSSKEKDKKKWKFTQHPACRTTKSVITLSDTGIEKVGCFACSVCNKCLAGQTAILLESRKYCWQCFEKSFGQKCLLCQKLITGVDQMTFIYHNNQVWHKDCFRQRTLIG